MNKKPFGCMLLIGVVVVQIVMKRKKFNQAPFFLTLPFSPSLFSAFRKQWKQVFDVVKFIQLKPQLWGSYELQRAIKGLFTDKIVKSEP